MRRGSRGSATAAAKRCVSCIAWSARESGINPASEERSPPAKSTATGLCGRGGTLNGRGEWVIASATFFLGSATMKYDKGRSFYSFSLYGVCTVFRHVVHNPG